MIEADQYCIDVLHHSLAVQKALKQIDMLMMEDHLNTCAIHQIKEGKENEKDCSYKSKRWCWKDHNDY